MIEKVLNSTGRFSSGYFFNYSMSVQDMTLNCILWWGSTSEALENVENYFIAITHRSTLTQSGRIC